MTAAAAVASVAAASVDILQCLVEVSQPPVKKFADLPNPFVIQYFHLVGRTAAEQTVAARLAAVNTAVVRTAVVRTAAANIEAANIEAVNTEAVNTAVERIAASSHSCHWSRRDFGPFGFRPHDRLLRRSDRQR